MNIEEFASWLMDFRSSFPVVAEKLGNSETTQKWFDVVFQDHDVVDAMVATKQLLREGAIKPFDADRIPAIYQDRMSALRGSRVSSERNEEVKSHAGSLGVVRRDACMSKMLAHVESKSEEHKKKTGEKRTPRELFAKWTEEASQEFDTTPDVDDDMPRYRCHECRDAGVIRFRAKVRRTQEWRELTAACKCETGKNKKQAYLNSGKVLSDLPSPADARWTDASVLPDGDPEDNPFNDALGGFE